MTVSRETPPSLRSLSTRIENLARERGRPVRRIQRAIANTVVGQMLPAGVVKGGTAIKLRVGEQASRFTPDLDASRDRLLSLEDYLDRLDDGLADATSTATRRVAVEFLIGQQARATKDLHAAVRAQAEQIEASSGRWCVRIAPSASHE